jgi:translation elongation factor aEF-1 beta
LQKKCLQSKLWFYKGAFTKKGRCEETFVDVTQVLVHKTLGEGMDLGNIVISFKIFPSEATVDLNLLQKKIEKRLPKFASVHGFAEEPIAFGLSALIAHIVLPEDRSGVLDEVENYLLKIKEISQIETIMVRRA